MIKKLICISLLSAVALCGCGGNEDLSTPNEALASTPQPVPIHPLPTNEPAN
jgi:hypothetical protein